MPLSVYEAQYMLDSVFGSGTPATTYIALFTTTPSSTGGGTEVTGGGYVRCAITNNNTNWPGATATFPAVKSNGTTFTFATATADWGTVGWFGIFDASSGGNLLWWGPLVTAVDVPNTDTYTIPSGNLQLTLG
jgi:hypothetical protein